MADSNKNDKVILLLDDEENNLFSFKSAFKRHFKVHTAINSEKAFKILEEEPVQVLITDQRMPDITGIEFIIQAKKIKPEIVCILMTGYSDLQATIQAINAGHVYYYIPKPWDEDQLKLNIEKAFEKYNDELKISQKTAELEKAYQELDQLVYSASHDMRTPLSSILGLTNLLEREFKVNSTAAEYINLIEESTERMMRVLNGLSEYSELHAPEKESENVDVKSLINNILNNELNASHCPECYQVKFEFEGEKHVFIEYRKIHLIFKKIIENAFLFHDKEAFNRKVFVQVFLSESRLEFTCGDNGFGILPEQADHVFNLFYRGSSQSKGMGIGLYLVKETVCKLGGKIQIESNEEGGTIIRGSLPVTVAVS